MKFPEKQKVFSIQGAPGVFDHCNLIGKGKKVKKTCGHLTHDFGLSDDDQHILAQVFCHVSFLCGILFVAMAAVPVSDALMWLLEEKKLCLFRWYCGESGWQEWMGLTHCGKLIFRQIRKVAKNAVWSCDLVQTKH